MPKITFTRENREIEVSAGSNLRRVALDEGIQLYPGIKRFLNCRGFGQCGECRVYVKKGMENTGPRTLLEKFRVAMSWFKFGHEDEVRLACQTRINGDVEIYTTPEFNWFGNRKNRNARG